MDQNRRRFVTGTAAVAALSALNVNAAAAALDKPQLIELPTLPYAESALAPVISAETIQFHYGKHHRGYLNTMNAIIAGTNMQGLSLDAIVKLSAGQTDALMTRLFQQSAQVWNHNFYWASLDPNGGKGPSAEFLKLTNYGSTADLRKAFVEASTGRFGSGWVWLVYDKNTSKVAIVTTSNEATPLTNPQQIPLCVLDVWEHAYYVDYRNMRKEYAEAVFDKLLNWRFVESNLSAV